MYTDVSPERQPTDILYQVHNLRGDVIASYSIYEEFADEYPRPCLGEFLDKFVKGYGLRADDLWTIYDHLILDNEYEEFRAHMMAQGMADSMAWLFWDNQNVPTPVQIYTLRLSFV